MTNTDWINSRPEITAGAVIAEAEAWYAETHSRADTERAGLLAKLTAWLAAERVQRRRRETTVVTTLTVTHILHGADADDAVRSGTAQRLAEISLQATRRGFRMMRQQAEADDVSISRVQVFGLEKAADAEAEPCR